MRRRYPWQLAFRQAQFAWRFTIRDGEEARIIRQNMARILHVRSDEVILHQEGRLLADVPIHDDVILEVSTLRGVRPRPSVAPVQRRQSRSRSPAPARAEEGGDDHPVGHGLAAESDSGSSVEEVPLGHIYAQLGDLTARRRQENRVYPLHRAHLNLVLHNRVHSGRLREFLQVRRSEFLAMASV